MGKKKTQSLQYDETHLRILLLFISNLFNINFNFSGISRRNSVDDNASSLSLENLGGSQNNLSLLGRNPDKEMRIHTGRRSTAELNNSVSQLHSNQNQISTENQAVFDSPRGETPNNDRYLDNREVEEMERRQRESMSPLKSQYVRLSGNFSLTTYQNFAVIWQVFLSLFEIFCHKL